MTDDSHKCCDCEMFLDGWCCEFGIDREYDDPIPKWCTKTMEDL